MAKYDEAIECFNKALEIDPNYADVWYWKSCSEVVIGDIDNGIASLSKAIEIGKEEYIKRARKDEVFENIRNNERFKTLVDS